MRIERVGPHVLVLGDNKPFSGDSNDPAASEIFKQAGVRFGAGGNLSVVTATTLPPVRYSSRLVCDSVRVVTFQW